METENKISETDMSKIRIRNERPEDYRQTENTVREAFWNVYMPGCSEHLILHKFRNHKDYIEEISEIMTYDEKIIGQIMFSVSSLKNQKSGEERRACSFGPVSMLPEFQKHGLGEYLIKRGLDNAKNKGFEYVLIFGNPDYYRKFGFITASESNVFIKDQKDNEVFDFVMIKKLSEDHDDLKRYGKWLYTESSGFETDEKELEEFDREFPHKIKEVREGQL